MHLRLVAQAFQPVHDIMRKLIVGKSNSMPGLARFSISWDVWFTRKVMTQIHTNLRPLRKSLALSALIKM
jgi:hypothetical protein